jgi:hypothetical protein
MKRRLLQLLAATAFGAGLAATEVFAEIPISVLRDMQDKAPEALRIHVLTVDRQSRRREFEDRGGHKIVEETISLTASARVQTVLRSATGLTAGSVVTIQYEINRRTPGGATGASPPFILANGSTVRVYLSKASGGSSYSPAAVSQSFVAP